MRKMSNERKDIQTLHNRFDMIQKQIEFLVSQLDFIEEKTQSFQNAIHILSEITSQNESQTFVEIADGIYIPAKIGEISSCVLTVGAQVAVSKTKTETVGVLEKQIQELQSYKIQFEKQLEKLEKDLDETQQKITEVHHV